MTAIEAHVNIDGLACAIATVEKEGVLGECADPDYTAMRATSTMAIVLIEHRETVAGPTGASGSGESRKGHEAA